LPAGNGGEVPVPALRQSRRLDQAPVPPEPGAVPHPVERTEAMSTMRSLRRQSMYGYQWKNHGRQLLLHPERLTTRQKINLLLMSTLLGRGLLWLRRKL
jgi:hypothetical protein